MGLSLLYSASSQSLRTTPTPPQVRPGPTFHPDEALRLVRASATAGFDETVEVQLQLGIDPRKPAQNIRGIAALPHGTGKAVSIAVFARGERADEARRAGATLVGAEELVEAIASGAQPLNFTKTIASPDVMPLMGKIARVREGWGGWEGGAREGWGGEEAGRGSLQECGAVAVVERAAAEELFFADHSPPPPPHTRAHPTPPSSPQILGPRGLMPNPKLGTVTVHIKDAVLAAKRGQAEFRAEKRGIVYAGIGKVSFEPGALRENLRAFLLALGDAKPEGLKAGGAYIRWGVLKSTMGPGIPVDVARLDPASDTFLDVQTPAQAAAALATVTAAQQQ